MDDIATHSKRLLKPYVRSPKAESIAQSAKHLARLVLHDGVLIPKHRIHILSLVQWFLSEADGKHTTRFRSKLVIDLATHEPTSTEKINHEHVFTRKEVVRLLLEHPERLDELLDAVVGCVVTKSEHDDMKGGGIGWARYEAAGIEVLDMSTVPPTALRIES